MWGLALHRLFPVLLASSSPASQTPSSGSRSLLSTMMTTTTTTPASAVAWTQRFGQILDQLAQPGPYSIALSPTLQFSWVPPPFPNGTSAWMSSTTSLPPECSEEGNHPDQHHHDKPLLIYLPGLDGYGSSSYMQWDDLAQNFELWRLRIHPSDRSSLRQVVQAVSNFVLDQKTVIRPTTTTTTTGTTNEEEGVEEKVRTAAVANNHHTSPSTPRRPVIVMGESCGGLLAAAVALNLQRLEQQEASRRQSDPVADDAASSYFKGLVLINPATSFDQTNWDQWVPLLTALGRWGTTTSNEASSTSNRLTPYSVLGGLILSATVPDFDQVRRMIDTALALPSFQGWPFRLDGLTDMQSAMLESFRLSGDLIPADTLEHRITQWLMVGAPVVQARLSNLNVPTLVVVGREDRLLPSAQEANRLAEKMPQCEKLVVPRRGHFVLDDSVNLTEALLYSKIMSGNRPPEKRYDPIGDWQLPPADTIQRIIQETVQPQRDSHSPVFISTDAHGKRWKNLFKLPRPEGRPLLVVGNHQFAGADLRLLVAQLLEERNITLRGLAHPIIFMGEPTNHELGGRTPGLVGNNNNNDDNNMRFNADFRQFGAVKVTPRNYYRLLESGQDVLLFPGGAKEALTGERDYPLKWPEKLDFVRMAARFNATIVPLSAIGMAESVNVLVQPKDVLRLPFLGDRLRAFSSNVTAARYDEAKGDENFTFPIAVPLLPARNYFLFGRPISTTGVDHRDREACEAIYRKVETEVRRGLDDLMRARTLDPFQDTPKRLAFERLYGKQAPTFPIEALNCY